jgi:hypothetical protein
MRGRVALEETGARRISPAQRTVLAKLWEQMPYCARGES